MPAWVKHLLVLERTPAHLGQVKAPYYGHLEYNSDIGEIGVRLMKVYRTGCRVQIAHFDATKDKRRHESGQSFWRMRLEFSHSTHHDAMNNVMAVNEQRSYDQVQTRQNLTSRQLES